MQRNKQDNAVTPAIATILIVLITVVVAATVVMVAMGLVNTQPDYVVGLTVKAAPSGPDAVVTLYSSRNLPELVRVEVIDAGSASGVFVEVWNGTAGTAPIGVPLIAKEVARPAEETASYTTNLWVKGTFADGTEQVLLMQPVTFANVGTASSGDEDEGEEKPTYTLDREPVKWSDFYKSHSGDGSTHPVTIPKETILDFGEGKYLYLFGNGIEYYNNRVTGDEDRERIISMSGGNQAAPFDLSNDIIPNLKTESNTNDPVGMLYNKNNEGILVIKAHSSASANWGWGFVNIGSINS